MRKLLHFFECYQKEAEENIREDDNEIKISRKKRYSSEWVQMTQSGCLVFEAVHYLSSTSTPLSNTSISKQESCVFIATNVNNALKIGNQNFTSGLLNIVVNRTYLLCYEYYNSYLHALKKFTRSILLLIQKIT